MDISISSASNIAIDVTKNFPQITVESPQQVDLDITIQPLELKPQKTSAPAFEFVQNVIRGSNVVRLTYDAFRALASLDGSSWYAVTNASDELRYLYLGNTLVAEARQQEDGSIGFAYTFPMVFGR